MSPRSTNAAIEVRRAQPSDAAAVAAIYTEGIEDRVGIGTRLLEALARDAEAAAFTKLIGKIFADNEASAALVRGCGFREVGVHRRHGRLDGRWKDVLLVERLLGEAAR